MPRAKWGPEKRQEIKDKIVEFLEQTRNNLEGDSHGNSMMVEAREMLRATGVRSERGIEGLCDELASEGRIQRYVTEDGVRLYYSNASGEPMVPWDDWMMQVYAASAVESVVLRVMWAEFANGVYLVIQFSGESVHTI